MHDRWRGIARPWDQKGWEISANTELRTFVWFFIYIYILEFWSENSSRANRSCYIIGDECVDMCYLHGQYAGSRAGSPAGLRLSVNTLMGLHYSNMTRSQFGKEATGRHAFTRTDLSVRSSFERESRFRERWQRAHSHLGRGSLQAIGASFPAFPRGCWHVNTLDLSPVGRLDWLPDAQLEHLHLKEPSLRKHGRDRWEMSH